MRRGIGRKLVCARGRVRARLGATSLTIEADPNAEMFLPPSGGGPKSARWKRKSKAEQRELPLLSFDLRHARQRRRKLIGRRSNDHFPLSRRKFRRAFLFRMDRSLRHRLLGCWEMKASVVIPFASTPSPNENSDAFYPQSFARDDEVSQSKNRPDRPPPGSPADRPVRRGHRGDHFLRRRGFFAVQV